MHEEASPAVVAALRRVLRVKRSELERLVASLPGVLRRGARVDLIDLELALHAAGVRCALRRREESSPKLD